MNEIAMITRNRPRAFSLMGGRFDVMFYHKNGEMKKQNMTSRELQRILEENDFETHDSLKTAGCESVWYTHRETVPLLKLYLLCIKQNGLEEREESFDSFEKMMESFMEQEPGLILRWRNSSEFEASYLFACDGSHRALQKEYDYHRSRLDQLGSFEIKITEFSKDYHHGYAVLIPSDDVKKMSANFNKVSI